MGCAPRLWLLYLALASGLSAFAPDAMAAPEPGAHITGEARFLRSGSFRRSKRDVTIGTLNLDKLYHYTEPPAARSNAGAAAPAEPARRAFYIPASEAAYKAKVKALARTIVGAAGAPDILAVQEVQNFKREDGRKPVLHDLVSAIALQSDKKVQYGYMLAPGESDAHGMAQAYLYRLDRVKPAEIPENHPAFRAAAAGEAAQNPRSINEDAPKELMDRYGQKLLNRPMLVALFDVYRDGVDAKGPKVQLNMLNTHLVSNPNLYKTRRKLQSNIAAKLVRDIHTADPKARTVVLGDMNVDFNQRAHRRQIKPLEELTPRDRRAKNVLRNLARRLMVKGERYTYSYRGQRELLDWMFISKNMWHRVMEVRIPHVNSDNPEELRSSDHDPFLATLRLFD